MNASARLRAGALTLLVALSGAACDDGTSPAADFDPRPMADAVAGMDIVGDDMDGAFAGLNAVVTMFGGTGDPAAYGAPSADARALQAAETAADIPSEYYGVTFVWDVAEGRYVAGTGELAPPDGVRIIYYAVDPMTRRPVTPLNPLGYVELRDLSTDTADRLAVMVVSDALGAESPLAHYEVERAFVLMPSSLSASASAAGYLSNGIDRLNFDVANTIDATETTFALTQDYSMDLEGTDIAVSYASSFTGVPESESLDVSILAMITNGADELVFELHGSETALEGAMRYQGATFVTVGGTLEAPVFTGADGEPLTREDVEALGDLWAGVGTLGTLGEDVLELD